MQLYTAGVRALGELPFIPKGPAQPYIPGRTYLYNIREERAVQRASQKGQVADDNHDSLTRVNLGALLLLGMSMKDDIAALNMFIDTYEVMSKEREIIRFNESLMQLLERGSTTREWIKDNNLDAAIETDWDSSLAELIVNLPEYAIGTGSRRQALPPPLSTTYGPSRYSAEAYSVFLSYASEYIQGATLTAKQARDLVAFTFNLRSIRNAEGALPFEGMDEEYDLLRRTLNHVEFRASEERRPEHHVRDVVPSPRRPVRYFRGFNRGGGVIS